MSRVRWGQTLLQRENFDFAHSPNGRLHKTLDPDRLACAVVGCASFIELLVPLARRRLNVAALSVVPESLQTGARPRAQGEQDVLCGSLGVPVGMSCEVALSDSAMERILWQPAADRGAQGSSALHKALQQSEKSVVVDTICRDLTQPCEECEACEGCDGCDGCDGCTGFRIMPMSSR